MITKNRKASDGKYYGIAELYVSAKSIPAYAAILIEEILSLHEEKQGHQFLKEKSGITDSGSDALIEEDLLEAMHRLDKLLNGDQLPFLETFKTNAETEASEILRTADPLRSTLKCCWCGERKCVNEGQVWPLYTLYREIKTKQGQRRLGIYKCLGEKKLFLLERVNPDTNIENFIQRCPRCQSANISLLMNGRRGLQIYYCKTCRWDFGVANFSETCWESSWANRIRRLMQVTKLKATKRVYNGRRFESDEIDSDSLSEDPLEKLVNSDLFTKVKKMLSSIREITRRLPLYVQKASDGNYYKVIENKQGVKAVKCKQEFASPLVRVDLGIMQCPICILRPCLSEKILHNEGFIQITKQMGKTLLAILRCKHGGKLYLCEFPADKEALSLMLMDYYQVLF